MVDKRESQSIFPCCEKSMLCLREKFYILFSKERLRNNRNEVVSRCSYGNKHELSSYIKVKVIYIYMVFTTDGFFEVAIESWPEWDLNPRPLNSVQTL